MMGKGSCLQACPPELEPQDLYGGKRINFCKLSSHLHMCVPQTLRDHTGADAHTKAYVLKMNPLKWLSQSYTTTATYKL